MSTRIPFQWNTADFKWDAINPTDGKTYPPNETVTGTITTGTFILEGIVG